MNSGIDEEKEAGKRFAPAPDAYEKRALLLVVVGTLVPAAMLGAFIFLLRADIIHLPVEGGSWRFIVIVEGYQASIETVGGTSALAKWSTNGTANCETLWFTVEGRDAFGPDKRKTLGMARKCLSEKALTRGTYVGRLFENTVCGLSLDTAMKEWDTRLSIDADVHIVKTARMKEDWGENIVGDASFEFRGTLILRISKSSRGAVSEELDLSDIRVISPNSLFVGDHGGYSLAPAFGPDIAVYAPRDPVSE
ncbi:MAG: hypothetical protein WC712_11965 [Candidatus Brocadiia bacterium]